jgi:hypothetical protein
MPQAAGAVHEIVFEESTLFAVAVLTEVGLSGAVTPVKVLTFIPQNSEMIELPPVADENPNLKVELSFRA